MERGETRSGATFARRNRPYYSSEREALARHPRLTDPTPAITTRHMSLGSQSSVSLTQTTARFVYNSPEIERTLRSLFSGLLVQYPTSPTSGYEVVVTFNALLAHTSASSYSVFYGHDHRADNDRGAARELGFGGTYIVRSFSDVSRIPFTFDTEYLLDRHRGSFRDSGVRIVRFLNVVYLIYR